MPAKKPTRKKQHKKKGVPLRITLLALALAVATVAGIASVKFFKTTRGKVVLLDAGISDYYSMVQEEIDAELRQTLTTLDLETPPKTGMQTTKIGGRSYRVYEWYTSCRGACSPDKIGLAFTKAAKRKGAIARSKLEEHPGGGETIVVTVGSRRYPTHQITIRSPGRGDPQPVSQTPVPRVAIVIDDFGHSQNETVRSFLDLDLPLTIAVLPALARSLAPSRAPGPGRLSVAATPWLP